MSTLIRLATLASVLALLTSATGCCVCPLPCDPLTVLDLEDGPTSVTAPGPAPVAAPAGQAVSAAPAAQAAAAMAH